MDDAAHAACPPLTDGDDALRRAGNRPDVARELFDLLRKTLEDTAVALRNAVDVGDCEVVRDAAHRLHGASLYCGVPRLHAAVAEVERLCMSEVGKEAGKLERSLAHLLETIEATRTIEDPVTGGSEI